MKLNCVFSDFVEALQSLSVVADDGNSEDNIRNIIFKCIKNADGTTELHLMAINRFMGYIHFLNRDSYTLDLESSECNEDGILYLQIKQKELANILSVYKNSAVTKVDFLDIQFDGRYNITFNIIEHNKDDEQTVYNSSFTTSNVQITQNIVSFLTIPSLENLTPITKEDLTYHIDAMMPLVDKRLTNNMFGKLMFDSEYVYAIGQGTATFMKTKVNTNHIFENISLPYKTLSFLSKVICNQDNIQVEKSTTSKKIYIKTDRSVSYIDFDDRRPEYKNYAVVDKTNCVCFNRLFFESALSRLSWCKDDNITLTFDFVNNKIIFKAERFTQPITMTNFVNNTDKETFTVKISKDALNKLLIGTDKTFKLDCIIYYKFDDNNRDIVKFFVTDVDDSWFTYAQLFVNQVH